NAYDEEDLDGETRVVLHLHHALAPIKVAVLPLQKQLNEKADEIYTALSKKFPCEFDGSGSIGKRYRRQDEIGTPFCITVDFDTLEDNTVTVRERDTMAQVRINIDDLTQYFATEFEY
ncbi:MAG TPA: His/Gly/Thr/Pro-type tRNA ligase C-terminal domain-containing protein, partial [Clostridia bacterium]|nr:His/Gly/Thr/Pro-type tRNA ligase C-terminal domain-containing protein [Clostridia bacterium]